MENVFRDQVVVVTGARGFIGSHVARQLAECGAHVRAITRSTDEQKNPFEFQWYQGDVTEPETLQKPFANARYIFHVAGDYRFWARDPSRIFANNVAGTKNVLELAAKVGAEKIVVTSTQGILEPGTLEKPGNETRRMNPGQLHGPYKTSKVAAAEVVRRFVSEGMPIVSVLPGAPIGESDLRPTPTGAVIVQFLRGKFPLLAHTGLSFVDVNDCARGHLLAVARGRVGEDYLLAGKNLWLREFFLLLAPYSQFPVPTKYAPIWMSRIAAQVSEMWYRISGSDAEPFITTESVRMSECPYFFSSDKAVRELGYTLSPLENAIDRAVQDFKKRGVV